jgi:hypothetical protein
MFEKLELFEIIKEVSGQLKNKVEGYLIGGLAMIFNGSKISTKDVDIVFNSNKHAELFEKALREMNFESIDDLSDVYLNLKTRRIFQDQKGHRFDLFVRTVCDGLLLTNSMKKRSNKVLETKNLKICVISPEDIFLFKAITSRPDDLADMSILTGSGLDWEIIEAELKAQPDHWKWIIPFFRSLDELELEFDIVVPLKKKLRKEAELAAGMGILLEHFKNKSISLTEAQKILKESKKKFTQTLLDKMVEIGLIKNDNGKYSSK